MFIYLPVKGHMCPQVLLEVETHKVSLSEKAQKTDIGERERERKNCHL